MNKQLLDTQREKELGAQQGKVGQASQKSCSYQKELLRKEISIPIVRFCPKFLSDLDHWNVSCCRIQFCVHHASLESADSAV